MSLTGKEDHTINLSTASAWTANYRATIPTTGTLGSFFGKDFIKSILEQDDCIGIRIYYALDDEGEKQLVITGVDEDGNDLYDGILAEMARKNPPYNVTSNPLNS